MTTPTRTVSVTRDDEHNVFALEIEDRSLGYPRQYEIGVDFITSGEYPDARCRPTAKSRTSSSLSLSRRESPTAKTMRRRKTGP